MGYQVNISREEGSISEKEWQNFVASDLELKLSDEDRLSTIWLKLKEEPVFFWEDSEIWAWSPDNATMRKMLEIAEKLDAKVIGEDETVFILNDSNEVEEI
jgi:hypothetical protein